MSKRTESGRTRLHIHRHLMKIGRKDFIQELGGAMSEQAELWKKWIPVLERELEIEMEKAPAVSQVHGIDHIQRVWKRCLHLGTELNADLEILAAAVYLHDLGRHYITDKAHGELSARFARPVLEKIDFPAEKREGTLHAIRVHDVTFRPEQRDTIESQILYDADKMETLGVIGILRYILALYRTKSIDFILEDIEQRWGGFALPETRKLANDDYEYIKQFFRQLKKETNAS
jgi:HD superfamily phosphodiesterase